MIVAKEMNPKDLIGSAKVGLHNVPGRVILEMGLGMQDGGLKYGTHNYRAVGVRASVYFDAAMRHLWGWWEGEDFDPDSKARLSHVTKTLTSLAVLRDSMLSGNWIDDRPLRIPGGAGILELNAEAAKIIAQYPNPVVPYLEALRESYGLAPLEVIDGR